MQPEMASEDALRGTRIVLLDAGLGVGLATATAAIREGASLVVSSREPASLEGVLARLPEGTPGHILDLANEDHVRSFFGGVGAFDHMVISDAEPFSVEDIVDTPLEQVKGFFNARFWGAYTAAKYGHRLIRPGGSIVLTSGIASIRPRKGWTVAACLCGATDSLARALAIELAPIRVNVVAPGTVRSALWNSTSEATRDAMYQAASEALPLGTIGNVLDIAEAYLFLMRSRYSTGQVIVVDGGAVLA
jgi:NAD(P)-dependent dehydrogenase (short-subunit alcohol dehydrogenase family)